MGYELPIDRVPSDQDSRVAFTIGVWARGLDLEQPLLLTQITHPLLGDFWRLELPGGGLRILQAWPHPQNQGQTLLVLAPGVVDG
jgi:hypothetical protein